MLCVCMVHCQLYCSELVKRREMLERVRREERRLKVVLEAQELEAELRKKESQLLDSEPES